MSNLVDEKGPARCTFRLSPEVSAFLRNPSGMAGLLMLLAVLVMAFLAPLIYPGDPLDMVAQPFLWPGQDPQFPLGNRFFGP